MSEIDYPPIFLVSPEQFWKLEKKSIKGCYGISGEKHPIISITSGLRGKVKANTIWHEVLHILFPRWKHWRIECAAERLAGGGGRGYFSKKYGHTVDEMPPREKLISIVRRASARMKKKTLIVF